jgi:hypothetical protein
MANPSGRSAILSFVVLSVVALLGGCGGGTGLDPTEWVSNFGGDSRNRVDSGLTVFRAAAEGPPLRAINAADLVGADGRCAAAAAEAVPRFGLTMTECEMVTASGAPDQLDVSGSAIGNRRTVMTYHKGEHPGVYTFVAGRLKVMEEVPGPSKPEPRKRVAKKPAAKKPPSAAPAVSVQ